MIILMSGLSTTLISLYLIDLASFLSSTARSMIFWFSTNQRSACLAKMPHWRVLRDHKSDLIRVIMFYYTAIFIIRIFLKVWLINYDPMMRSMRFSLAEKFVYSQVQTLLIVSQIANHDEESAFVLWHFWPRLPRCAVPRIEFWKFSGFNTFCMIGEPMETIFCGD